ncbi:cysteine desulfuration [Raphidocelis subcapitata]|uniref:Cysteine desulfuration n=1 Tax=Raphidocelis subcapitata TaxID=307507 RepID=A0A2V0P547_9CHLO|nr:cysteine desulfuration [Raphidocelis subcapitata]|eukprot:GBF94976.1 cysteine desulfuration [Raphidocelis subcapitata]
MFAAGLRVSGSRPGPACPHRRSSSSHAAHRSATIQLGRPAAAAAQRRQRRQLSVRADAHQPPSTQQLPASLQKIVGAFQIVPDPMARYKQLLFYAAKLPAMKADDHVPDNKVEGCVSQVWVKPELREDGLVYWTADSDSQLTKGLAALLVLGLSGCTPQEILSVQPSFIELLGLKQSLTPSRNNGFLNMLLKMQRATLALAAAQAQ